MCGILLQYTRQPCPRSQETFKSALTRLNHRGPDAQSSLFLHPFYLGHTRLSIIDLSTSRQPFRSADGLYTLIYNGELYNYLALKSALQPHWNFRTSGDTEVLLAGLVLEGHAFLHKMNGMWAFALVNHPQQSVLLSRDPMGKKPLYYSLSASASQAEELMVASEIPALTQLRPNASGIHHRALSHYFQYGYTPNQQSIYQHIRKLPPGSFATWSADTPLRIERYWSPINKSALNKGARYLGSYRDAQDEFKHRLTASVKQRLVSDVEVGCLLSGGVDSSVVATIAADCLSKPLKTFCVGFDTASYDESQYARTVAQRIGAEHTETHLSEFDPQTLARLIVDHVGEPFADISILPTFIAFQLASQRVKVVLSGDGADELLSGYRRYQARHVFDRFQLGHPIARVLLTTLSTYLGDTTQHHSRSLRRRLRLLSHFCQRTHQNKQQYAPEQFDRNTFQSLFPTADFVPYGLPELSKILERSDNLLHDHCNVLNTDSVFNMQVCDQLLYLPEDILVKVDRAAMACSVEPRAPFLDKTLVSFANSLPTHFKQSLFSGKRLLKASFQHTFPKHFLHRKKQGFAVPIGQWFKTSLGTQLLEMAALDTQNVHFTHLQHMLSQHQSGQQDYGLQLWLVYCYFLWLDHHN